MTHDAERFEASRDLLVLPGARGHEYVRIGQDGIRAKLGIDATVPYEDQARFARCEFADVAIDASLGGRYRVAMHLPADRRRPERESGVRGEFTEVDARRVVAYCTHPVLSGAAIHNITGSALDELVVTDTIPRPHRTGEWCRRC